MDKRAIALLGALAVAAVVAYLYFANRAQPVAADPTSSSSSGGSVSDAVASVLQDFAVSVGFGTPRGIRNNNPGNIVRTTVAWEGQLDQASVEAAPPGGLGITWDPTFVQFDTPANGVRAIGHVLLSKAARGLSSVDQIIRDYSATDQDGYVANVAAALGVDPHTTLDVPAVLPQLAAAIIQQENGQQPYASSDIQQWVYA